MSSTAPLPRSAGEGGRVFMQGGLGLPRRPTGRGGVHVAKTEGARKPHHVARVSASFGFKRGERKFCFLNVYGPPIDKMGKWLKDGSVSSCQRWCWLVKDIIFALFWEGVGNRAPGLNV